MPAGYACLYLRVPPLLVDGERVAMVELLMLHAGELSNWSATAAEWGEGGNGDSADEYSSEFGVVIQQLLEAAVGKLSQRRLRGEVCARQLAATEGGLHA